MKQIDRIKAMNSEELGLFLMKVNLAYDMECMFGMAECKYANEPENACAKCFRDYLESECEETLLSTGKAEG